MNRFDFVELINLKEEYNAYNLYLNAKGFVIESYEESSKIFFFNAFNEGDYAFVEVLNEDLKPTKEQPSKLLKDMIEKDLNKFTPKEKGFKPKKFKAYEQVQLLVEEERYAKYGVHKGDIGTIMEDVEIQDCILVDFGRLDENNNYYGDCISVKIDDIKRKDDDFVQKVNNDER